MSNLPSLQSLLVRIVNDLHCAETQLTKALPGMAGAANDSGLKKGFEKHLAETKVHTERLEEIAAILGIPSGGRSCRAMKALVEEGAEAIAGEGDPVIRDLALITAARKIEHYEMSGYGSARELAEALHLDRVVTLLQATLDEEGAAEAALIDLSDKLIPTVEPETSGV